MSLGECDCGTVTMHCRYMSLYSGPVGPRRAQVGRGGKVKAAALVLSQLSCPAWVTKQEASRAQTWDPHTLPTALCKVRAAVQWVQYTGTPILHHSDAYTLQHSTLE